MSFFGQPLPWHVLRKTGFAGLGALVAAVALMAGGPSAKAAPGGTQTALAVSVTSAALPQAAEAPTALSALPDEARATYRRILSGGPFPHAKDGVVFGNRERLLPVKRRGFYHEYTVRTPGAHDRGARRIVCGGEPPDRPQACFYTADHYASFRMIAP